MAEFLPHTAKRRQESGGFTVAEIARLFFTREEAAKAAGVSLDTIRRAINAGHLRAKRTGPEGGGKYLVSADALRAWFEQLADA